MVRIISSNYNEYSGYDRVCNSSWRKLRGKRLTCSPSIEEKYDSR